MSLFWWSTFILALAQLMQSFIYPHKQQYQKGHFENPNFTENKVWTFSLFKLRQKKIGLRSRWFLYISSWTHFISLLASCTLNCLFSSPSMSLRGAISCFYTGNNHRFSYSKNNKVKESNWGWKYFSKQETPVEERKLCIIWSHFYIYPVLDHNLS